MNKEIKEILDYMQEYIKPFNHDSEPMLNSEDIKILLDYITNLQKENKQLKERIDKALLTKDILDMWIAIDSNKMLEKIKEILEGNYGKRL